MSRVPYRDRSDGDKAALDLIERLYGTNGGNLYAALLNVPQFVSPIVGMAQSLRRDITIARKYRELAVVLVGALTGSQYEFKHHWNEAIELGIPRRQLESIQDFENSENFDPSEKAVLQFAKEITLGCGVSDHTWHRLRQSFSIEHCMEIQLVIAWYNCVVRLIMPLEIDLEEGFELK